jgi:hypothetical protein
MLAPADPPRSEAAPRKDADSAAPVDAVPLTTRGTPRQRAPKGTFDRKAYQREKQRERRAKLREQKP